MCERLEEDEKQNRQIRGFGNRGVITINESGLYSAILGSTKPEAKPFKKWVTSEVLPTIRKTGSYTAPSPQNNKPVPLPSATASFKSMHSLAKLVGLEGNQAILSANNAVLKYHGVNCLDLLGHTSLTAKDQRGRTYTATQLGNEFMNMTGKCGARVNQMLESSGVMSRDKSNRPIPTDKGDRHGEWADTGKHHGGAPIKEWRWFETVIDLIQPLAA